MYFLAVLCLDLEELLLLLVLLLQLPGLDFHAVVLALQSRELSGSLDLGLLLFLSEALLLGLESGFPSLEALPGLLDSGFFLLDGLELSLDLGLLLRNSLSLGLNLLSLGAGKSLLQRSDQRLVLLLKGRLCLNQRLLLGFHLLGASAGLLLGLDQALKDGSQ